MTTTTRGPTAQKRKPQKKKKQEKKKEKKVQTATDNSAGASGLSVACRRRREEIRQLVYRSVPCGTQRTQRSNGMGKRRSQQKQRRRVGRGKAQAKKCSRDTRLREHPRRHRQRGMRTAYPTRNKHNVRRWVSCCSRKTSKVASLGGFPVSPQTAQPRLRFPWLFSIDSISVGEACRAVCVH